MPSIISHPAVPLALAPLLPQELRSPSVISLGIICSMLPDLDVVGFRFGVPYGHLLGHRGLSHSIAFAVILSVCLAWLLPIAAQGSRLILFGFLFSSTMSHGLLDALTSGGLGVAFFAPLVRGYPETVLAKKAALLDSWRISHVQRSAPTCGEMASLGRGIPRL